MAERKRRTKTEVESDKETGRRCINIDVFIIRKIESFSRFCSSVNIYLGLSVFKRDITDNAFQDMLDRIFVLTADEKTYIKAIEDYVLRNKMPANEFFEPDTRKVTNSEDEYTCNNCYKKLSKQDIIENYKCPYCNHMKTKSRPYNVRLAPEVMILYKELEQKFNLDSTKLMKIIMLNHILEREKGMEDRIFSYFNL